jgi:hypothetical protein
MERLKLAGKSEGVVLARSKVYAVGAVVPEELADDFRRDEEHAEIGYWKGLRDVELARLDEHHRFQAAVILPSPVPPSLSGTALVMIDRAERVRLVVHRPEARGGLDHPKLDARRPARVPDKYTLTPREVTSRRCTQWL